MEEGYWVEGFGLVRERVSLVALVVMGWVGLGKGGGDGRGTYEAEHFGGCFI